MSDTIGIIITIICGIGFFVWFYIGNKRISRDSHKHFCELMRLYGNGDDFAGFCDEYHINMAETEPTEAMMFIQVYETLKKEK